MRHFVQNGLRLGVKAKISKGRLFSVIDDEKLSNIGFYFDRNDCHIFFPVSAELHFVRLLVEISAGFPTFNE